MILHRRHPKISNMGDNYTITNSQVAAVGHHASAINTRFEAKRSAEEPQPGKAKKIVKTAGKWIGEGIKALGLEALKKLVFKG